MSSLPSGGGHAAPEPAHAPDPQASDLTPAANSPAPEESDLDSDAGEHAAAALDRALAPDPEPLPPSLRAKLFECAERWLSEAGASPDPQQPGAHPSGSNDLAQFHK